MERSIRKKEQNAVSQEKPDREDPESLTPKQKKDVISVYAAVIALALIVASFIWNMIAALPWKD